MRIVSMNNPNVTTAPQWALDLVDKVMALPSGKALEISLEDAADWGDVVHEDREGQKYFLNAKLRTYLNMASREKGQWRKSAPIGYPKSFIRSRRRFKPTEIILLWSDKDSGQGAR